MNPYWDPDVIEAAIRAWERCKYPKHASRLRDIPNPGGYSDGRIPPERTSGKGKDQGDVRGHTAGRAMVH